MQWFLLLPLTLAIGAAGASAGLKLRLPAGCMVGSMAAVMVFNVLTGLTFFPTGLRVLTQMLTGAMIGVGIRKKDIRELNKIGFPILIMLVCMVILNVLFGTAMYFSSKLDIATCLFASSPGGLTDVAIIAGDLGANTGYVAMLQVTRLVFTIALIPPLFARVMKKRNAPGASAPPAAGELRETAGSGAETERGPGAAMDVDACGSPAGEKQPAQKPKASGGGKKRLPKFLFTAMCAVAGGGILYALHVPAGPIFGGMALVAVANIFSGRCWMPGNMRPVNQTLAGAYIGTTMTREYMLRTPQLFIPMLIIMFGVIVWCFLIAFIINRLTGLDLPICMLACAPGGLQDMCLLAEEMGLETSKIALMHTARVVSTISLFPILLAFITTWFGA